MIQSRSTCLGALRDQVKTSLEEEQQWENARDGIDMEVDLEAPLGRLTISPIPRLVKSKS